MTLLSPRARILVGKELRQLTRRRSAVVTTVLLPLILLVAEPLLQLAGMRSNRSFGGGGSLDALPGVSGITRPTELFVYFLFPIFIALAGLLTPSLAAVQTIVVERERRSLELLIALPLSVRDIISAKLAANLVVGAGILLPLYAIDAAALLMMGVVGPLYLALGLLLLVSALACSVGIGLLVALLARDFRTANNLSGAFVLPFLVLAPALLAALPGVGRLALLAAAMLAIGALAYLAATRWLTFERYMT